MELRKVLAIRPYGGTNRLGHPSQFRYLLECGHVQFEYYSGRHFVRHIVMNRMKVGEPEFRVHCRKCAAQMAVNPELWILADLDYLPSQMVEEYNKAARKSFKKSGR